MYLIANLAIANGSGAPAPTASTVFPSSLRIDYIRVWKLSATGIAEQAGKNNSVIYPNPFNEIFTVKISPEVTLKDAAIHIYDLCGKEVKILSINSYETIMDKDKMETGIYFYSVMNNNECISNGKLIVQ